MAFRPHTVMDMVELATRLNVYRDDPTEVAWADVLSQLELVNLRVLHDRQRDAARAADRDRRAATPRVSGGRGLSRNTDPATSHAGGASILPFLGDLQQHALALVRRWPDSTGSELAANAGMPNPYTVKRRLSELLDTGVIVSTGSRPCRITRREAMTYREA